MDIKIGHLKGDSEWLVCQDTLLKLLRLETLLHQAVITKEKSLREIVSQLIRRKGKRIRPALLLLASQFGNPGNGNEYLLDAAVAMELIHVASLHHDDVIDRAKMRRGGTSSNASWGNSLAAFAGTFLFARACALLASLGDFPNKLTSQATANLCAGQLQEVENAYNLDLSEAEHLAILAKKTASLFVLPCHLGAWLGGASQECITALFSYGQNLGLAFQLADDALDLAGQANRLGKDTGMDLRQGVYSLPILRVLKKEGEIGNRLKETLAQASLKQSDIKLVLSLALESGTISESLQLANKHARQAQAVLERLPEKPARLSLYRLAEYTITRST